MNDGPSTLRNLSARFPPPTPSNAGSANAAPLKSKTTQMSDWSRAPLSDTQIAYAAQDAIQSEVVLRGLHERWGAPLGVSVEDFCAFFADATSVGDLIASDAKLLAPGFNPCAALTMYRARNVLRRIGSFYIARYVAKMNALDDDDPADAVVKKTTEWETLNRICFLWGADLSVHAATEVNGGIDGGDGGGGGDDDDDDDDDAQSQFVADVRIHGRSLARARGKTKKSAIRAATSRALDVVRAEKEGKWFDALEVAEIGDAARELKLFSEKRPSKSTRFTLLKLGVPHATERLTPKKYEGISPHRANRGSSSFASREEDPGYRTWRENIERMLPPEYR